MDNSKLEELEMNWNLVGYGDPTYVEQIARQDTVFHQLLGEFKSQIDHAKQLQAENELLRPIVGLIENDFYMQGWQELDSEIKSLSDSLREECRKAYHDQELARNQSLQPKEEVL